MAFAQTHDANIRPQAEKIFQKPRHSIEMVLWEKSSPLAAAFQNPPQDSVLQGSKEIKAIIPKGSKLLIVSGGGMLLVGIDSMEAKLGFCEFPPDTHVLETAFRGGSKEFYVVAKGAKTAMVVYWSQNESAYVADFINMAEPSGIVNWKLNPDGGIVIIKEKGFIYVDEGNICSYDLAKLVEKYGQMGHTKIEFIDGKVLLTPHDWESGKAMFFDPETRSVKVILFQNEKQDGAKTHFQKGDNYKYAHFKIINKPEGAFFNQHL